MSSNPTDYSVVQDEDVLKRMWEDTDDFGRKKEIRAHMYKIREARLRDFYTNTGESETIKTTKSSSEKMTHADSLGDQSFLSLKTKEIRDSESPTRDAYKITGVTRKQDHGWDIIETNQSSDDGKHRTSTRLATTSGKQDLRGGEATFAAKSEQKASVFQDGDDKNFTKSSGSSSHNVVKQEAHGGDENSKFYSSSTTQRSSSQYKSEHKSTSGDFDDKSLKSIEFQNESKVPKDFQNADGKTKVFTETKTLPDGSTVTTTRYETVGSKSYATTSSKSETQQQQSRQQSTTSKSSNVHVENVETPSQEVTIIRNQKYVDEDHSRRLQDLKALGRDTDSNVQITRTTRTETRSSAPTVETKVVEKSEKIVSADVQHKNVDDKRTTETNIINYKQEPIETTYIISNDRPITSSTKHEVTSSTTKVTNKFDDQKVSADNFINVERQHVVETNQKPIPTEIIQIDETHNQKVKEPPKSEPIERREPFRPPKSEMDEKRSPTEGQYETTYRTDYTSKKISVDVSPTHDAFVRSLRSVSPDRSRISSAKSSRTPSQSSLRSSPEKTRSPEKARSPEKYKKSKSPDKYSSTETFTKSDRNVEQTRNVTHKADSTTTRRRTERVEKAEIDTSTLTRKKKPSRSPSPTTTASEIEYIRSIHDVTTDLDTQDAIFKDAKITRRHTDDIVTDKRPKTLEVTTNATTTTTKKKKVTERSPTSPLTDFSPKKTTPNNETKAPDDKRKPFRRTDTYEERCKEILGLVQKERKDSLTETTKRSTTTNKQVVETRTDRKKTEDQPRRSVDRSPTKKSPVKKSPEKEPSERPKSPKKGVSEFPAQIRRSPEKQPTEHYPGKPKQPKEPSKISEFPSQIRRSPEKEPSTADYRQKPKEKVKDISPQVCEFPSQIRRSPEKEPLGPYPEKYKEPTKPSKIAEFPSQIRKRPEKEPSPTDYHQKPREARRDVSPQICEFPSQVRRSPEKEILELYPEKFKEPRQPSKISQYPSQTHKTTKKEEITKDYFNKATSGQTKITTEAYVVTSETRRSSDEDIYPEEEIYDENNFTEVDINNTSKIEYLDETIENSKIIKQEPYPGDYPQKPRQSKKDISPQIYEFPSQTRKSPEKEPLGPYPEKPKDTNEPSKIPEFPSQTRTTYEENYLEENIEKTKIPRKEPYPKGAKEPKEPSKTPQVPSQIRKPHEEEYLEETVEKSKISRNEPYPKGTKEPNKPSKISEFPSQTQKSPGKEPASRGYPDKPKQGKKDVSPQISEFPSQFRRSPDKEALEPYPEKAREPKEPLKISELPSQIRKTKETEYVEENVEKTTISKKEPYAKGPKEPCPDKTREPKVPSKVSEVPSEIRKTREDEYIEEIVEKTKIYKKEPYPKGAKEPKKPSKLSEFPSQIQKSPEKEAPKDYPEKSKPSKKDTSPQVSEFPSQIRRSPEKEILETYPEKTREPKKPSKISEFPSQIRKTKEDEYFEERETIETSKVTKKEPYPKGIKEPRKPSKVSEFPSQIQKSPEKEPLPGDYPEKPKQSKKDISPQICEFPSQTRKSPENEPLETYPEKSKEPKAPSKIPEFLSQIRKSPEKDQPSEKSRPVQPTQYPGDVCEYPLDNRQSPERKHHPQRYHDGLVKERSPDRISLDDLPLLRTDKRTDRRTPDRVSLSDLEITKESEVDSFIRREQVDTEITLKKYDQKAKQQTKKTDKKETVKKRKDKKLTTEITVGEDSDSSEDVDEVDETTRTKTEIDVDIRETSVPYEMKVIESVIDSKVDNKFKVTTKKVDQNRGTKKEKIEVRKVQNLESRKPVKEVIAPKKSVQPLCEDTRIKVTNKEKLQTVRGITDVSHKIVKKDQPEKMLPTRIKPRNEVGVSEYTEKFTKTTTKVEGAPKSRVVTTTKITITPVLATKIDSTTRKVEKKTIPRMVPQQKIVTPSNTKLTKTTIQKTIEAVPSNRHVVSTIINLKPKTTIGKIDHPKTDTVKTDASRTIHRTTITKNVISPSSTLTAKPKSKITPSRVIPPSKPDQKKKLILTNGHLPSDEEETDQEIETIEKTKKKTSKQEKKCITTKSILIENAVADEREIIVDLKRSKSSREGTPDRICPYPVTIEDSAKPRFPDKITEPEEVVKTKKVTTEIIREGLEGFDSKISEVTQETDIKDECLLTVNEKVSKFLTTAEDVTKSREKPTPAKIEREILDVDRNLEEDDCLLSVSDKVSKFITTAEALTKPKRAKSPMLKEDVEVTVEENDESLLSVSEKVSHFIATAEKVKKPQVTKTERTPSPEKVHERSPSPRKERPVRKEEEITNKEEFSIKQRRESLEIETTPKTSRRSSKDEPKTVLSPTGRLRSTETIKKAKALFENISKEQEAAKQRDILNRQSVFEVRKQTVKPKEWKPTESAPKEPKRSDIHPKDLNVPKEDEEVPHYMTPLDRTVKDHSKPKERQPSDQEEDDDIQEEDIEESEEDIPHYMLPLDRSLRERSPHKENMKQLEDIMTRSTSSTHQIEETDSRTTKFGVTLRRTDSGRMVTTQKTKIQTAEKQEEINIEEIFDLEYLERLLETTVGYDIRRRIRAQIRVVKKLIEEERLEIRTETVKKTTKSPARDVGEVLTSKRRSSSVEHQQKVSSTSTHSYVEQEEVRRSSTSRRSKSPVEKTRKTPEKIQVETKKVFQTELKKTKPIPKKLVEEKPEWVTQKTLKKVSDTPIKRSTITTTVKKTTTTARSEKSPSKEITDVITSSYGVGPLDENGTPLFGLKALRAQNKSEKTKVQGTVIQSQYYSENGEEPIGEISVTKYSTDPNDLESNEFKTEKGVSSVTTTQKFGYKGTPSLKTVTGRTKAVEGDQSSSTKTTKVTRRGSVKEISQKFIENAVDTLKNERKTSFPKAGLILRTSSFKETSGNQSPKSASSRETSPSYETRSSVRTVKTSGSRVDTFLTNKSKVTGVQDVITRMKNEEVEGESIEDIEAKNLLNKFIGSQVLLSGMESMQDAGGRSVTKITTSVSESGQPPKTVTRTFTHPITPDLLKTVWDQQTLNLLLEQSTDYEDRRVIRTRLREVMAEQEACTDLVEKAAEDARQESRTSIQGESLLLPLLQGLLDKPDGDQPADSGTESGEDLRSGLVLEVQTVLDKLASSLKSSPASMTDERRNSLLQLVARLQQGLSSQVTPSSSSERRSSLQGSRFGRKKQNRQSRHTVGVTSEELEDARRLMEEIGLNEGISQENVLTKQNSEGSVLNKIKVKNLTAKPFVNSNATSQSQSGTSSTVDTPTETSESIDFLASSNSDIVDNDKKETRTYNQSVSMENPTQTKTLKRRPLSDALSLDFDAVSIQKAIKEAATNKINSQSKNRESDTDDDPSTVKNVENQPKPDLIMQTNPVYNPNDPESDDEFINNQYNEKANRFNTKKLRMKRANTIDIPKPLKYYECDEDESENEDTTARRNSYLALRGPIHVGKFNVSKRVPQFEAKTENDKKFLAFISKQKSDHDKVEPPVKAPWTKTSKPVLTNNTKNNFGKIKRTFEKENATASVNTARNFWKSADDAAISAGKQKNNFGPKISRQSARNLQQMFEEKQRQNQQHRESWGKNVVTGSLKVDTKNLETNNLKVITQPNPINQFSHNPMMSAFKPVRPQPTQQQKTPDNSTVFLYSPKPFSPENVPTSPMSSTPWSSKSSESRVLSIAASKFENPPKENVSERKMSSSNKIVIPAALKRQESLSSPHIVKNLNQNSSVRKLSGQYDSLMMGNQNQMSAAPSRIFVPGENYTIQYDPSPQKPNQKPNIYNAEYTITQKINFPPIISDEDQHNLKQLNYNHKLHDPEPTANQPDFLQDTAEYHKSPVYEEPESSYHHTKSYPQDLDHQKDQSMYYQDDGGYQTYQKGNDPYQTDTVYQKSGGNYQDYQKKKNYQEKYQKERTHQKYLKANDNQNQSSYQKYHKKRDHSPDTQKGYQTYNVVKPEQNQHKKSDEFPQQFTSNFEFKPKIIGGNKKPDISYDRQLSDEGLQEYTAISSRVMTGPVGQAVVVQNNSPKSREQHDMDQAFNLRNTLQKLSQTQNQSESRNVVVYNNTSSPTRKPVVCLNDKPMESLEINEDGETILTSKFHIQVKPDPVGHVLSKSESWHQICQGKDVVANKPSPRASPNSRMVARSKSSHSLAVPKQYEAGMSKQEMAEKQKSLQAYFGTKSQQKETSKKSSINRIKTSQKISTQKQTSSSALSRSQTLPDVICLDRLDDDNIDEVFEEIFKSST